MNKCGCIGCDNVATHTWSGHPTCDACRPEKTGVTPNPKSPYDVDAHVSEAKPVFTQAMADAGELVGGITCEYLDANSGWRECYIVGRDQGDYIWVIQSYESVFFMPEDGLKFRPIQTEREKAIEYAFSKMFPSDAAIGGAE